MFMLIPNGEVVVPKDFNLENFWAGFLAEHGKGFHHFARSVKTVPLGLTAGQTYSVGLLMPAMPTEHEVWWPEVLKQEYVTPGAVGLALLWQTQREVFLRNHAYHSFARKEEHNISLVKDMIIFNRGHEAPRLRTLQVWDVPVVFSTKPIELGPRGFFPETAP